MTRKQKKELRQRQTARQLMGIDQLTDHGLKTPNGELVFYCIQPDNLSVLPCEEVRERVLALGNLLRTTNEMILMALDSRESFQHNQLWYRQRLEEESTPALRQLLRQDMAHLNDIQSNSASSREFAMAFRLDEKTANDPIQLAQIAKRIHGFGFQVRLAEEQDIKRILAVYYQQDVVTDHFPSYDGEEGTESLPQATAESREKPNSSAQDQWQPKDFLILAENPVSGVRLPKTHRQEMRVLDRQEQNRLILASRKAPEPAAFGIIFDLFTGLRLGELCALRWKNVNMDARCFRVCGTRNRLPNFDPSIPASTSVQTFDAPKTDSSRRVVYLMDGLYEDFIQYYNIQKSIAAQHPGYNPEGYVFCQENGQPYEPRAFQDLFKRCLRQAGIADANFHSLRHTFATRSLEQGMDVVALARILGHSSPSITLDKYGHALADHQRTSVQKLDSLYEDAKIHPKAEPRADDWTMTPSW